MCGIFAYVGNKKNGQQIVLEGLKDLEYRGYDSWGIAIKTDKNNWWIDKKVGKIGKISSDYMPSSQFTFGHTRWATHGGVTESNAHPHQDCSKNITLIHNGIVENYDQLKKDLKSLGHKFVSQTDSEVIVHLIEENFKSNDFKSAVINAFKRLQGLSAIIVASLQKNEFIAIKNGSPLVIGFGEGQNYLASDASALLPHTKKVYFMKDMEYVSLTKDNVVVESLTTGKKINVKPIKLDWDKTAASKGIFEHFMLKEIHQQPDVIKNILASNTNLVETANKIKNSSQTYFIGCGTAANACQAANYIFSKKCDLQTSWCAASEFKYQTNFLNQKSLVIALSQSGETMDTLEAVKAAKAKKANIIALVNVLGSSLDRESNISIPLLAGPEKAVASTKAFTAKLTLLFQLAEELEHNSTTNLVDTIQAIKNILKDSYSKNIKTIAKKISKSKSMFVIGRGISYPISMEVALKIKEVSYVHAEGIAAGELKHGLIALIEKGTPCLVFAPDDEAMTENITAAMELKARGAYVVGVSPHKHEVFDAYLQTQSLGLESAFQNTVIGQLLAYYMAVEKGIDPDMPRNLAKSVTVK